jgi:hypothetical protein
MILSLNGPSWPYALLTFSTSNNGSDRDTAENSNIDYERRMMDEALAQRQ